MRSFFGGLILSGTVLVLTIGISNCAHDSRRHETCKAFASRVEPDKAVETFNTCMER